jgi:hypothetical protein
LLEFKTLHFTRVDLLPDPFVDRISEPTLNAVPGTTANAMRRALDMMRISRQAIFVNCWYANRAELPHVWEECGGINCGVAIRSSIGALRAALQRSSQKVHISSVSYLNYDTEPIPLGNAFLSALHKDKRHKDEREVRALFLQTGSDPGTFSPGPEEGIEVQIETATLIEEVLPAPQSDPWFCSLVNAVCRRAGLLAG